MTSQPLEALKLANATRIARASLKREVESESPREGRRMLAGILENPSPVLNTLRVCDMLCWAYGLGPDAASKIMRRSAVWVTATVGGLTDRQRVALAKTLRGDRFAAPVPSDLPLRKKVGPRLLPAEPLAEAVEARIRSAGNGAARVRVCREAGISQRTLYAWREGKRQNVQVDVADRVLTGLGLNWWDVWDKADQAVTATWNGRAA